jgi:hypothetical protein
VASLRELLAARRVHGPARCSAALPLSTLRTGVEQVGLEKWIRAGDEVRAVMGSVPDQPWSWSRWLSACGCGEQRSGDARKPRHDWREDTALTGLALI